MTSNKKYIIIVSVIIIAGGLFIFLNNYFSPSLRSSDTEKSGQAINTLIQDVYPLYSGTSWGSVEASTSTVIVAQNQVEIIGYKITSEAFKDIYNIATVTTPFSKYYRDKLKSLGWAEDIYSAAGGPGSDITVYKKDGNYVIVEFHTVFKAGGIDSPGQCPCDTTLSVFSGTR